MLYRLVHLLIWISFGAILALASGKAERRQVHPLKVPPLNEKRCTNIVDTPLSCSVGGDGFEPPKASPADLQSAPFGHSGNHPTAFVLKASAKVQINFDTTITLHSFFSLSVKTNAKIVKKQLLTL
jgi:hypothetical protein